MAKHLISRAAHFCSRKTSSTKTLMQINPCISSLLIPKTANIYHTKLSAKCIFTGDMDSLNNVAKSTEEKLFNKTSLIEQIVDYLLFLDTESVLCKHGSAVSRCAILDYYGSVVLDIFIKPHSKVVDYRYKYSGIVESDLLREDAVSFTDARNLIINKITNRIVVGQAIQLDFKALNIFHKNQIDIQESATLNKLMYDISRNSDLKQQKHYSLRKLSHYLLNKDIQKKFHCPVEDTRTALQLFQLAKEDFCEIYNEFFKYRVDKNV